MEQAKPYQTPSFQERARRLLRHENATLLWILLGLIFGVGGITKGATLTAINARNVLLQSAIRGIASIGQAFVILTAGIDVSVGGNGLFCTTLGASLVSSEWQSVLGHPIATPAAILIMLISGLGWGAVNGTLVSKVGIPALISTLGIWQITDGGAYAITQGDSIGGIPDAMVRWGQGEIAGVPIPVIIFIVVAVIAYYVLNYTSFGRSIYATGGNPASAWLSGINTKKILFAVYLISGFCAGLAGFIQLGRVASASLTSLDSLEMDSIAAVAIGGVSLFGGRGNLIGVIIGSLIMGVINNTLSVLKVGPAAIRIVKGAIIIIAVGIDTIRQKRSQTVT